MMPCTAIARYNLRVKNESAWMRFTSSILSQLDLYLVLPAKSRKFCLILQHVYCWLDQVIYPISYCICFWQRELLGQRVVTTDGHGASLKVNIFPG